MNRITSLLYDSRIGLAKCVRVAGIFAFLFGLYMLFSYSVPMLKGNYGSASNSYAADRCVSLYDTGLQFYQAEEYKPATLALTDAYNACLGPQGLVSDEHRKLAANIKFLTGNALVYQKQLKQAVEAYKEALRLDPDNLEAKYNLELLQQMNGGKGPSDDPSGGDAGKGIKRGI